MNSQPYLLMSKLQAARFREETAGDQHGLDPILVRGGKEAGNYVLPERVLFDDNHEARRDAFRMLTVVVLDPAEAFPPFNDDE